MPSLKHSVPKKIVLIGASTGGPAHIQKIITALPKLHNTSVIVAQHMAKGFIPSFAKRLKSHSINPISVAESNMVLESAYIYFCCGYTKIYKEYSNLVFSQQSAPLEAFNPDINMLFHSFSPFIQNIQCLSVILTGIGDDGVSGCKELVANGALALTETQQSAVVDGMPSRARESIENIQVDSLEKIIKSIVEFCE